MIYLKNETFCDTSHHQVIYKMLKLKSRIKGKNLYTINKNNEIMKICIVMLHRF